MAHILDVELPQQNPSGAPGGNFQNIPTNPGMFGGFEAEALQQFGHGLQRAGETALDAITDWRKQQLHLSAAETKTWFADQTTDLHSKFMSLEGKAAQDALPDYKKQLSDLRQQALEQAPSSYEKQLLAGSLTNIQDQYWRYWSGHAAGQMKVWGQKVASDAVASNAALASSALLAGDQQGFERHLASQDNETRNLYESHGYDAPTIETEVMKRRGATLKTTIETVAAAGDTRKAQEIFDRYRDRMDPQSVFHVTAYLKRETAQLDGRAIGDEESGHAVPPSKPVENIPAGFVSAIKASEGFTPKAKWDVNRHSIGYGTKANSPDETITREEGDKRFGVELGKAAKFVDSINPDLDPGTRAALASLTYNAGTAWASSGLGDAIRRGDIAAAKQSFLQYVNAGGEANEGLMARRYREAQWFGQPEAPAGVQLVDKQQAYERVLARTDSNPLVQNAAIARLNQVYAIFHSDQVNRNAGFDQRLRDTTTEALSRGTVGQPLTEPEFVDRYGVTKGQEAYRDYQANLQLGSDIASVSTLSEDDARKLYESYTPQSGPGFAAATKRQEMLGKAIEATEKARASDPGFKTWIDTSMEEAGRTGKASNPVPKQEFMQRLGAVAGEAAYARYSAALRLGADVHSVDQMSPDEQKALVAAYDPLLGGSEPGEMAKRQETLGKAITQVNKERDEDPAAFALRRLPAVKAAWDAFQQTMADPQAPVEAKQAAASHFATVTLAEQQRVGVAPADQRLLPKTSIDAINQRLSQPATAGGTAPVADLIGQEATLWGSHWPLVYRQLSKEARPVVRVIGAGVEPTAARLLVDLDKLSAQQILKDESNEKVPAVASAVRDAVRPFAKTLVGQDGGASTLHDFEGQVMKLAAYYVATGEMKASDGADRAFKEVLGHKYEFRDSVRIPKSIPEKADRVMAGADAIKRQLGDHGIEIPADTMGGLSEDYRRSAMLRTLQRDGVWVTLPGDSGVALIWKDAAVRKKDGTPLTFTWRQLADAAAEDARRTAGATGMPQP